MDELAVFADHPEVVTVAAGHRGLEPEVDLLGDDLEANGLAVRTRRFGKLAVRDGRGTERSRR